MKKFIKKSLNIIRRTIMFSIFTTIGFSCSNTMQPNEEQQPIAEKITQDEALHLLHKWTNAYLTGDAAILDEVLDESWLYSGSSNGKTSDKAATIEEFSNADYKFQEINYEGLDVRIYGDIALVRGSEKMVIIGNSGKDTTTLKLRFTDVYQKKNGKIKAIATHSSPITEE